MSRGRRRIAGLVDRLVESPDWDTTRVLLGRYPELVSQAAEDHLAELAEAAAGDGDRENAAVYWFHRELMFSRIFVLAAVVVAIRASNTRG